MTRSSEPLLPRWLAERGAPAGYVVLPSVPAPDGRPYAQRTVPISWPTPVACEMLTRLNAGALHEAELRGLARELLPGATADEIAAMPRRQILCVAMIAQRANDCGRSRERKGSRR